jgi:serine/threonine-protein kinase
LAEGGFAQVYKAFDTIEGIRVALKIPQIAELGANAFEDIRKEVRMTARLDHPHILPIKDANFIEGRFVVVQPLGEENLNDRLRRRMSFTTALGFFEQLLDALRYAHEKRVVHCDVKPDNIILFSSNHLRLADFGLARIALRTFSASGSGTVGYMAPEQAMGKPSFRSDVFSAGLIAYRMFSGILPEWPFTWPLPGMAVLRRKAHPDLIAVLRKALEVDSRKRYKDAGVMARAFSRVKRSALGFHARRLKKR